MILVFYDALLTNRIESRYSIHIMNYKVFFIISSMFRYIFLLLIKFLEHKVLQENYKLQCMRSSLHQSYVPSQMFIEIGHLWTSLRLTHCHAYNWSHMLKFVELRLPCGCLLHWTWLTWKYHLMINHLNVYSYIPSVWYNSSLDFRFLNDIAWGMLYFY